MRKLISLAIVLSLMAVLDHFYEASDYYVRHRVFKLFNKGIGSCTGIQIRADSGTVYMLTAAHCRPILIYNILIAEDEDGKRTPIKFIAEDPRSDLMLLTSADDKYVDIAKGASKQQKVHTITHGMGLPSFRTDGELLNIQEIQVPIPGVEHCVGPKYKFDFLFSVCVLDVMQYHTTAWIIPGSSGGPLLDESGHLLGIATATTAVHLSSFVTLKDIHAFLQNR